jgi:hypothetical protein
MIVALLSLCGELQMLICSFGGSSGKLVKSHGG